MNVTERIRKLLSEQGKSINKMSQALGFGSGTFATWESNGRTPNGDIILKIADYLGVSTDYLLGRTDKKGPATESGGEPSKAELVYRSLPPEKQEEALRYMEYLAEHKGK